MTTAITTTATKTMTSLELVALINSERKEGRKELLHKNFMAKIEKHPAIQSAKFLADYKDASGRTYKCYHLPEREAKLMVMSESLEVQAKVYDRMKALEDQAAAAPQAKLSPAQLMLMYAQQNVAIEQEQQRISAELDRLCETVAVIEARTQPENKHFTVMGYSRLIGQKIDLATASRLGRKCADLSRAQGMVIGDVTDPRFGKVHSYHETILQAVLDCAAA